MRYFGSQEVQEILTPARAEEAVAQALRHINEWEALPPREAAAGLPGAEVSLWMTAAAGPYLAGKWLHGHPQNQKGPLPSLMGQGILVDRLSGELLCVVDGAALTGVRTAAIASLATRRLASGERVQALLGAGYEAWFHLCALLAGHQTSKVYVWNRTPARAMDLIHKAQGAWPAVEFVHASTPAEAAAQADVITLVTASQRPLLSRQDVPDTVLINAMGAYQPCAREVASDLVAAAAIYADTVAGVLKEAGDILIPLHEGIITTGSVRSLESARQQPKPGGVVVMKSVGAAIFDAYAMSALYDFSQGSQAGE